MLTRPARACKVQRFYGTVQPFFLGVFFSLEFIREQTNTSPPYTYGLGKVGTTSGSEHTTRQNRTEVKPDGAHERSVGERGREWPSAAAGGPFGGMGGGTRTTQRPYVCVCHM